MIKPILAVCLSSSILLATGELGARLWIKNGGNVLARARLVLELDSDLGWKQKPRQNTLFFGLPLKTNELGWRSPSLKTWTPGQKVVLILGPSSSFGWGVREEETYASQLQSLIPPGRNVFVINAGEIGYSSDQGRRLYERFSRLEIRPHVVIIAYGINDLDRHRFYFQNNNTDAVEFSQRKSELGIHLLNNLYSFQLFHALLDMAGQIHDQFFFMAANKRLPSQDPVPKLRVPLSDFLGNTLALVESIRANRAKVILLTTKIHLSKTPRLPPQLSEEENRSRNYTQTGTVAWMEHRFEDARGLFERASAANPRDCVPYYYLSELASAQGDRVKAGNYLDLARANEPYRLIREVAEYNLNLKALAIRNGVPILDLDAWLNEPNLDSLFVDPIHFSRLGNARIAEGIKRLLERSKALNEH